MGSGGIIVGSGRATESRNKVALQLYWDLGAP